MPPRTTTTTRPSATRPKAGTRRGDAKPHVSTTVVFVRHGNTATTGSVLPGRTPGLHLSEVGHIQAEHAARRLGSIADVRAVYASPLERTRETAKPIATGLGLRVRSDRGLLECDFGEWTGQKLTDLMKRPEWHQVQQCPSRFRFPGGESFTEMQARIGACVDRLIAEHSGGTIVLVSHADPIKAAVCQAQGVHLDLFQRTVISPCSLTLVSYGALAPTILAVNSTGDDLSSLAPS